ncbi:MAG TPA: aminopeptidase P N-terminal domain-containing protein [Tepidisphaeraceae bacterium]|nr:aminopeptidase P N-terminal domain-containing protein [Tepidisphaeraceae bacterium]
MRELYFQDDFSAGEFLARRARVMEEIEGGVALIAGAPEVAGFEPFRQNNDFYYLCGVEVSHAYLLIDADRRTSTLYLQQPDAKHEETDGPMLGPGDGDFVKARTGVEETKPLAALVEDLRGKKRVWLTKCEPEGRMACQDTLRHMRKSAEADPMDRRIFDADRLRTRVLEITPGAELIDLSPILQRLRIIKSPAEIELMRKTGRLSAQASLRAMEMTRVGLFEYQLGGQAESVYLDGGARGGGYRPIIAAGKNIWMMHYWRNDCRLSDGEMVLFDYAPDLGNYTNDIGRMWPVNGKFNPEQREVYGFVVEYHKVLLSLIRAGRMADDVLREAAERMKTRPWNFSTELFHQGAMKLLESKRPLSHGVGMAVHEADAWRERPMEEGLVFAVDPEFVVPELKLYVRCEDTVVVTREGCENLTSDAPVEIDLIEAVMRR